MSVVIALALSPMPALAQSSGAYREYCQQANGHIVCKKVTGSAGTAGTAPYERWQDGSPAQGSGAYSADRYRPNPLELGRPNPLYGFRR
jgi:hypothetical protein